MKSKTSIVGLAGGALLLLGGLLYLGGTSPRSSENSIVDLGTGQWLRGPAEALAVLVEFSDFQCPACGAYEPLLQELKREFGDSLTIDYRHFPLPQHGNAIPAARAAEAAGTQGKFWEMHDLIFVRQAEWATERDATARFEAYAQSLGLDMERFRMDAAASESWSRIEQDRLLGLALHVNGTPTFFLNGQRIENPQNYNAFREVIQAVLAGTP